jgi:hypothetical protein
MFRDKLPRLYELRDLIDDPASPDAYFQNFEKQLADSPHHVLQIYLRWETTLQALDLDAWEFLKKEARPYLTCKDAKGRGWEQLFNILNQGRAYGYLRSAGCSNIRFIPRADGEGLETPDVEAVLGSDRLLCEVKSINISQDEVRARTHFTVRSIPIRLGSGFFKKLQSDIDKAKNQMCAYDQCATTARFVYINFRFDDFLAQCKEDYFRQIDEYLSENPPRGVRLIFNNDQTAFYKPLTMANATVHNED